jgi:plastocyanin
MRRAVVAGVALALLTTGSVDAATEDVEIGDNFFSPETVRIAVGDLVHWSRSGDAFGDHNVRAARKPLFYSGAPTANPNFNFRRRFSAGKFHYWCELHTAAIMDGFVRVPAAIRRAPKGLNFGVQWATGRTNTGGRFDVQFRVGSGRWRPWRRNTKSVKGIFGKGGRPVRVVDNKRYSIRARSQAKGRESGWSPVKSIRP